LEKLTKEVKKIKKKKKYLLKKDNYESGHP